jgi:hypothetical protein
MGWNGDFASGALDPFTLYEDHPFDGAPADQRACKQPAISALPLGEGPTSETYQTPTFTPWSYRFGNVEATQPSVADPGASVSAQDIALEDVDVTSLVGAKPITPTIAKRTQ